MDKNRGKTYTFRYWKLISILMAVIFSLVGFGLTPQAAFAQDDTGAQAQPTQGETISLGNVGVFSPAGFNDETFSIEKVGKTSAGFAPVVFIRPLVRINATTGNFPNVLTYVFFNVRPGSIERSGRSSGVNIWFREGDDGGWQRCANTFVVDDRVMGGDIVLQDGGTERRVACLVTRYNATYGVGIPR